MKSWNTARKAWLAVATTLLVTGGATQSWAIPQNFKGEAKCHSTMNKTVSKHMVSTAKALVTCRQNALEGGPACPDADALAAIDKSATKAASSATKACQSECSLSSVPCIADRLCPPNGTLTEECTALGKNFFDIARMSFPGPYCDVLSSTGNMRDPEDFGSCSAGLGANIASNLVESIYGELDGTPALSEPAQECLDTIAKSLPKTVSKIAGLVSKCRAKQVVADPAEILPSDCATGDEKVAEGITKNIDKFTTKLTDSCTEMAIGELSICKNGLGGTPSVAAAVLCFTELIEEASHSGDVERTYAPVSIINAAWPQTALPRCGDNLINQLPNQFALSGEECDGTTLGTCAACLPPGDTFECTCAETRRSRVFADGFNADLDNGWTGSSHNSKTPDGAGFVAEVSGCDCTDFTGATCTGTSGDPVCDVTAEVEPRCSHRIGDGTSCTEVGNEDQFHTDDDCRACSAEADNADEYCTGEARYCFGGVQDGERCNDDDECDSNSCSAIGRCYEGPFQGEACQGSEHCGICTAGTIGAKCSLNSHCGVLGVCEVHNSCAEKSCFGGSFHEQACNSDAECSGEACSPASANAGALCDTDSDCTGVGATCDPITQCGPLAANAGASCAVNGDCLGDTCAQAYTPGRCAETSDCNSRCYDAGNNDMGPCWRQADCAEGERCRGICDDTNYCLFINNSAPLPLSSEGTSVCVESRLYSNISGTRDIVSGSHALNYELRSLVHFGGLNMINSVPCPVCGGFCALNTPGASLDRYRCEGSCSGPELACRYGPNIGDTCLTNADCSDFLCSALPCRFDDDCPTGTCSGEASPDCLGKDCRLDFACSVGPNEGLPCRIEAYTAFGTTSSDCPPWPGANATGNGLTISWTPLTSASQTLESPAPCDAVGFQNYDCNCVTGGGATRTAPNKCAPACDNPDPEFFGRLCDGFTQCAGGSEPGASCDEDSDCGGGGTCSSNPRVCGDGNTGYCSVAHCVGGDNAGDICATNSQCEGVVDGVCTFEDCTVGGAACADGFCQPDTCTTNADCEMGVTCDDVCPSGRCTPLCVERGTCVGGDREGKYCALDVDCIGGGVCQDPNPEEGACAKGQFNHCDGPGWEFVSCAPLQVGTKNGCEWGTDGFEGGPNANVGAGFCRSDINHCFVNDGTAAGGGDPTNSMSVAVFCIPPTSSAGAVNATAGLPGPGRIRQPSTVTINFDSLP
jgi:hypothetical protein